MLQLASTVFSVSDYHHPVTTPAFTFMAQALSQVGVSKSVPLAALSLYHLTSQSQVKSVLEMLRGLILCDVMMQVVVVVLLLLLLNPFLSCSISEIPNALCRNW